MMYCSSCYRCGNHCLADGTWQFYSYMEPDLDFMEASILFTNTCIKIQTELILLDQDRSNKLDSGLKGIKITYSSQ